MLEWLKKLKTLKRQLQNESLLLISGEAPFLIETIEKDCKEALRSLGFTCLDFEAKDEDIESFQEKLSETSLFGEKQAYFAKNVEQGKSFYKLLEVLKTKKNLSSPLILIHKKQAVTANLKKELKRLAASELLITSPKPFEIKELLVFFCDKAKVYLEPAALELLQKKTGDRFLEAYNQIAKLSLIYGNSREKLSAEEILPHIESHEEEKAFILTNYLLEKQIGKAQAHMTRMIHSGESPLAIVGMITYFCRTALYFKTEHRNQNSSESKKSSIRLPRFLINRYHRHRETHTEEALVATLQKCFEADIKLKSKEKILHLAFLSSILSSLG